MQVRDLVERKGDFSRGRGGGVFPDFRLKAILGILLAHSLKVPQTHITVIYIPNLL